MENPLANNGKFLVYVYDLNGNAYYIYILCTMISRHRRHLTMFGAHLHMRQRPAMHGTEEIAENLRDFGTTRSIQNHNIKTHQNLCLKSWKPENHGENIIELPSWKAGSICFGLTRWLFSSWKRWLRTRDMTWYGYVRSIIDLGYLSQRRKPFKITLFIIS